MPPPFAALQELGDDTRLRVFLALLGVRKNVSQIVAELGLAQPQVSYHLRKLKDVGLAVEEKDGRWVWYQANWEVADPHLREFIELMARWAEDTGVVAGAAVAVGAGATASAARPVAGRRRAPASGKRPTLERPEKKDTDLDDFLL